MTTPIDAPSSPTRREFCSRACQAASLIATAGFVGCSGSPAGPSGSSGTPLSSVSGSVSGRTITVNVDGSSPLAAAGSQAMLQTPLGVFLIARMTSDVFRVLAGTCTHEACAITSSLNGQFFCPCHGSRFTTDGGVLNGPARQSLSQYATQFTGTQLVFTV